MSIRRTERQVVQPDGSVARVATTTTVDDDPDDAEALGNRFDALMEEDDRRAAGRTEDQATDDRLRGRDAAERPVDAMSRMPTPARMPGAGQRGEAGARAAGRGGEHDRGASSPGGDDPAERAAQSGQQQGSHRKTHRDDHGGGHGSGGDGSRDGSAAMVAMTSDPAPPPSTPGAAEPAPEPRAQRVIGEIAGQVAARISASGGGDAGQVRIDLRDDVLPETSLTVENRSGTIVVTVDSGSHESSDLLSSHAKELGQAIGRRTGRATEINIAGQTWTSDGHDGASGRTRSPADAQDD